MDSLIENLAVGLGVGAIVSLLFSLYYSKFKEFVIGLFVVTGVVTLYGVVEFYWDYDSGNRGNLEQTLLNHKLCEWDPQKGRNAITVNIPNVNQFDSDHEDYGKKSLGYSIGCEMPYGNQCELRDAFMGAYNMNEKDMKKYFPFLCK